MGGAFTPGLMISANTAIRKVRRLPIRGQVLARVGDRVEADTVVAQVEIPGTLAVVKVAQALGCGADQIESFCLVKENDRVRKEQVIARRSVFFGLFTNQCRSPRDGTVEYVSKLTGNVGVRGNPTPVSRRAYVSGTVAEVIEGEGVVIETAGALVQGIFGVGGERLGEIKLVASGPDEVAQEVRITEDLAGKVIVCGSNITGDALRRAAEVGVAGVVVGGIIDRDLIGYLGHDIGVAITGQEDIPTTVIVTEGFGVMRMADRTFELLRSLEGHQASINGATQIRAGVIRPEIIVPAAGERRRAKSLDDQSLDLGAKIRVIREPHFGLLGKVTALPPEPVLIESGSKVRILEAELENGAKVSVPRANVEIIQE